MWMSRKGLTYQVTQRVLLSLFIFIVGIIGSLTALDYLRHDIDQKIERQLSLKKDIDSLRDQYNRVALAFRGYLAFGREVFLQESINGRQAFGSMLDKVKELHNMPSPYHQEKHEALERTILAWNAYSHWLDVSVELKKQNKLNELSTLTRESGTPSLYLVMDGLNDLQGYYELERKELLVQGATYNDWGHLLIAFALAIAAINGFLLIRYIRKSVITPVLAIEAAVHQIGRGQHMLLPESKRNDELGALQHGINQMTRELEKRHHELEDRNKELMNQRDMLEVQNEEIIAQQVEQEQMLQKLTAREKELEVITNYQEKLTGFTEMSSFLEAAVPSLMHALKQDAATVVLCGALEGTYEVLYSIGYPKNRYPRTETELYGVAQLVFESKQPISRTRPLTGQEQGIHAGYEMAVDQYHPLLDDKQQVVGFILLTSYQAQQISEWQDRLIKGLVRQFGLAILAQNINEERREQSIRLEQLNEQLQQERQTLHEQRDLVERILESIHEGMVMCDDEGTILYANERMETYFQLTNLVGQKITTICADLTHEAGAKGNMLCEHIRAFVNKETTNLQVRFPSAKEGRTLAHFELYANSGIAVGKREDHGHLFVFRDRTEEEKVDELKNEFVSIVSHELRTPLATVLGFMEILLYRTLPAEKQKKYMETIYKEAQRLSDLINDFLDLQRMESGKQMYQYEPLLLNQWLPDITETWQGKQSHQITLHLPAEDIYTYADRDRLTQVFHNLISNAIKYSPSANQVDVHVTKSDQTVSIAVIDYGLGIPADTQDKLFTKFYRVDNSDRRQIGGTGLGLAIVKEIVEGHHGSIHVDSELGNGSTFTIELGLYELPSIEGKIVIVEDDDSTAKLITEVLAKLHMPMVQIRSAEEAMMALKLVKDKAPQLFIVDIQLEGIKSGWDFITELNCDPHFYDTPVIVSTVMEPPIHYYEKATEKYVQKPFSVGWMLEVVQELLATKRAKPDFIFPYQDEKALTDSLQKKGIEVADVKVKSDFIEVDVKKRDTFE